MESREPGFPAELSQVDIAGGEAVNQLQVTVLGSDVDGCVSDLKFKSAVKVV